MEDSKFFLKSLAIWGTIVTGASAILPTVSAAFGYKINPADILQLGDGVTALINAGAAVVGTFMILRGRFRASAPLSLTPVK
jgi:hypothetical protein